MLCNTAASLSLHKNKKVLVIDVDPQCNATSYVLGDKAVERLYDREARVTVDIYLDSLARGKGYNDSLDPIIKGGRFGFDLIPGDPKLALREDFLASDWKDATGGDERGLKSSFVFKGLLSNLADYDYVFFDVGPSLGALNRSVLLSSGYFLMPMTADVFSIMAIKNIGESLRLWNKKLDRGLSDFKENRGECFRVADTIVKFDLKFLGYVSQHYKSKTTRGVEEPVKAYERILKKINPAIVKSLSDWTAKKLDPSKAQIGKVKNLHSLVPLSQSANCPVFALTGKDGVVGGHFASVRDSCSIFSDVADHIISITT